MDHLRRTPLHLAEYVTLESARAESGISAEEIARAAALGLIASAEIGSVLFIERGSLRLYCERRGGTQNNVESLEDLQLLNKYVDWTFEEDNQSNAKEREVFKDALIRDRTTSSSRAPLLPVVSVCVVAVLTLILSVPFPRAHTDELPALASREELSAFTRGYIHSFLARSNEAYSSAFRSPEQPLFADGGALTRDGQAAAVAELRDPFSLFVQEIAASIQRALATLFERLATSVHEFLGAFLGGNPR